MRKLIVAAALCVLAFVLAPIGSASANVTGACEIKGEAEFVPGLGKTPAEVEYKFKGKSKCATAAGNVEGETTVKGKAQLQCAVAAGGIEVVGATGAPGKGFFLGTEDPFELSFVAQAGVVDLLARPEGETGYSATGEAQFLTTNGPTEIVKCAQTNLKALNFEAQTAGTV